MTDLWSHFSDARWFSGKGRGGRCVRITPLDWYGPAAGQAPLAVRSEVATIEYPQGEPEYYQLLVSYRPEPLEGAALAEVPGLGWAHDATKDPQALRLMLDSVVRAGDRDGSWHSVVLNVDAFDGDISVFGGEQSNTNLMVGDSALVKLFRKLEPGRNLDISVHDALGRAGVTSAATLYGWVEGHFPAADDAEVTSELAMMVEQFRDVRDGWQLFRDAAADGTDMREQAAALGRALAEVHRALADTFPASRASGDDIAATMERRLDAAVDAANVLQESAPGLRRLFSGVRGRQLNTQQVHGDFHLGQVLLTADGWRIIDFEGEPMKTLAERKLPDSKWRDVAGMLRSFGYATSGADDPGSEATQQWLADVTTAFTNAYQSTLSDEQRQVLDAYIADKAIYEVVYEVRNRPDWVDIPLRAVRQLASDDERN